MVKKKSQNIFIGLKKKKDIVLGVFRIKKNVTKTMKTGLEERGVITKLSNYALFSLEIYIHLT